MTTLLSLCEALTRMDDVSQKCPMRFATLFLMLVHMEREKGGALRELDVGAAAGYQPMVVNRAFKKLALDGLVTRRKESPYPARNVVATTAKGRALAAELEAAFTPFHEEDDGHRTTLTMERPPGTV